MRGFGCCREHRLFVVVLLFEFKPVGVEHFLVFFCGGALFLSSCSCEVQWVVVRVCAIRKDTCFTSML